MLDDLDRLLDEAETAATAAPAAPHKCGGAPLSSHSDGFRSVGGGSAAQWKIKETKDEDNIEALLEELLEVEDKPLPKACRAARVPLLQVPHADRVQETARSPASRCCPVYLGGSKLSWGLGTTVSCRACDRLHCTVCDFRVVTFDNVEWHKSCDYLFFRNNMPDVERLRAMLVRRTGARAYACQCSWRSVHEPVEPGANLRWVCSNHSESS